MSANTSTSAVADLIGPVLCRLAALAPRPVSLEATGLAPEMLADLVLKHLLRGGSLTSAVLGERLGLVGPVLEPIVQFLRQECAGCFKAMRIRRAGTGSARYLHSHCLRSNGSAPQPRARERQPLVSRHHHGG